VNCGRVRYLISRALTIRASDPQNALAQEFTPLPGLSSHFSHFLLYYLITIEIHFNTKMLLTSATVHRKSVLVSLHSSSFTSFFSTISFDIPASDS